MRHHLCLSGLSRPENRRKTSHVYDVEVCIVVQQDLCRMLLGCSRLLHRWGTPHQCFLHQLYKICVLQLWSKHWTSAHKQSMYNYMLHNAKTGTATLKKKIHNCNSFQPLSTPRYMSIAGREKNWTLEARVQMIHVAPLLQKKLTPRCEGKLYRFLQRKDVCFLWRISRLASKFDSWNCPVNF